MSAVLTFFSMPPFALGGILFIGLIPVFAALEMAETWKQAAFRAWLYVFISNCAVCFWVAYCVHEFANFPWALSIPCVLLVSVVEQFAWPVMAALRFVLHRKFGLRPILWTPLALMVMDFFCPKFFPDTIGNGLYRFPALMQIIDVVGIYGLTALVAATNEIGAALLLKSWPKAELRKHVLSTAILVVFVFVYGNWRLNDIRGIMKNPHSSIRVAMVQPNIGSLQKVESEIGKKEAKTLVIDRLINLSKEALKQEPEIVVWPETAFPIPYQQRGLRPRNSHVEALDSFIAESQVPFLFGGHDRNSKGRYNSLFMVTPRDNELEVQRYHKNVLLVPSERIPFTETFPAFGKFVRRRGGPVLVSGEEQELFQHPKARLGVMICLEGLYAGFVRELALMGAEVLVNVANDSWFGPFMEPDLHLEFTAFRSIETRRPMIRSTNTGYSAIIDIDGSIRTKTTMNSESVVVEDVPIYPPITSPFMRWGDLLIALAGLLAALPFLILSFKFLVAKSKSSVSRPVKL